METFKDGPMFLQGVFPPTLEKRVDKTNPFSSRALFLLGGASIVLAIILYFVQSANP